MEMRAKCIRVKAKSRSFCKARVFPFNHLTLKEIRTLVPSLGVTDIVKGSAVITRKFESTKTAKLDNANQKFVKEYIILVRGWNIHTP